MSKNETVQDPLSNHKKRVTEGERSINSLDQQYKRVITELRRQLKWWQSNAWKATFLSLINRLRKVVKK